MSDGFYRLAFLIGSIFNVLAGLLCIIFYRLSLEVFFGPGVDPENLVAALFYRLFMVAVMVFGVGYFLVYLNLQKNRAIVWLGSLSKLILLIVFSACVLSGSATIYLLIAVLPDFLFMLVYFLFLWQRRA